MLNSLFILDRETVYGKLRATETRKFTNNYYYNRNRPKLKTKILFLKTIKE